MTLSVTDSRYPYTYSADYICKLVRGLANNEKLSRSDAAYIVKHIAEIIGMDEIELKTKIADRYIKEANA
jgi:hypothetical protein